MPLPIKHDDYDSDPEVQAEKELAKKDPEGYAINANSLVSQKKATVDAGKEEVSTTPPDVVAAGPVTKTRTRSSDDSKKPKVGNQTKALKKQRSRGISGCSSKKFSGYDDDYDGADLDGYDAEDVFDEFDEDEEYNTTIKKQ